MKKKLKFDFTEKEPDFSQKAKAWFNKTFRKKNPDAVVSTATFDIKEDPSEDEFYLERATDSPPSPKETGEDMTFSIEPPDDSEFDFFEVKEKKMVTKKRLEKEPGSFSVDLSEYLEDTVVKEVTFRPSVIREINNFITNEEGKDGEKVFEVMGSLFGDVQEESIGDKTYYDILVTDFYPSSEKHDTLSGNVPMDWSTRNQDQNTEKTPLGWLHTHPDLGVFFSPDDTSVHRLLEKYEIGVVIDHIKNEFGIYSWKTENDLPEISEEDKSQGDTEMSFAFRTDNKVNTSLKKPIPKWSEIIEQTKE